MAIDAVRINGTQLSWPDVISKIDGEDFSGFTSLSYGDKLESVMAYGTGRAYAPRGQSAGKYTVEPVKCTMWKASAQLLRARLAAKSQGGKSYGTVFFQWVIGYVTPAEVPEYVELVNCRWASNSMTAEESADPLKEEIEFSCQYIKRNGTSLFNNIEGLR